MSLATKTTPHLAWSLNAATAPPEVAAAVTGAASVDVLGVTPETPLGEPVKGRGNKGGGGGGGGGDAAAADEAMADAGKAAPPARSSGGVNAEAEAAAAEAAVDAVGDDGALG